MSSRRTQSNKSTGTYNYASKGKPTNRTHGDGARREKERRSKLIETLRNKLPDIPFDAFISDTHNSLVKVMVPYSSSDPRAALWRGSIVDYERSVVIKYGSRVTSLDVPDDFDIATQPEATETNAVLEPGLGGALVSVFKYKGVVYFSTGRSLGVNASAHPGAINIKEKLIEVLPEGLIESLFDSSVVTYKVAHDFLLLDASTLDVTRAPIALPSVIYNGTSCLTSSVSGSSRTETVVPPFSLTSESLYPTEPGFYSMPRDITLERAQQWLSGEVTGVPEDVLIVQEVGPCDRRLTRLRPYASHVRHLVRGDVASIPVRLTELLADYDYEVESGDLVPLARGQATIHLQPNLLAEEAIRDELIKSLPLSREEETRNGLTAIFDLKKKLMSFYQGKYNPNHPAAPYHQKYHNLPLHELSMSVWKMTQEDLFFSLRWYKLI